MKRVAVIGAGNWGKNLVTNFHALGVLEAVVDASPEIRERVRSAVPGVRLEEEMRPVLDSVDAIAIATPAPTHCEVALEAIAAGKDVFIEKPMTLTSEDADRIIAASDAAGRIAMVGHLLLYQPAISFLHDYLAGGKLGPLYSLHQERCKLGRARRVEDVLWSFGVHDLAVLLYLTGQTPSRFGSIGHCGLQPGIADDVHGWMEFPAGVHAHLHVSWLWPETVRQLTVIGEHGMLVYEESVGRVTLHRKTIGSDLQNRDEGNELLFESTEAPLERELRHFLACCDSREPPLSDARSGREVVRLLEQMGNGSNSTGFPGFPG